MRRSSCTDVVGIFPNEDAITRLVGALLLEQNDEWSLQRRHMQLEGLQSHHLDRCI
jgi:putative transposase